MANFLERIKRASLIIIAALIFIILNLSLALFVQNQQLSQAKTIPITTSYTAQQTCPVPTAMIITNSTACNNEFIITATNYKFSPNQITVHKGDHVKITFRVLEGYHDLTISAFAVQTPRFGASTGKDATIEFVANKTGTFDFIDSVADHSDEFGQKGTLIVK